MPKFKYQKHNQKVFRFEFRILVIGSYFEIWIADFDIITNALNPFASHCEPA